MTIRGKYIRYVFPFILLGTIVTAIVGYIPAMLCFVGAGVFAEILLA